MPLKPNQDKKRKIEQISRSLQQIEPAEVVERPRRNKKSASVHSESKEDKPAKPVVNMKKSRIQGKKNSSMVSEEKIISAQDDLDAESAAEQKSEDPVAREAERIKQAQNSKWA